MRLSCGKGSHVYNSQIFAVMALAPQHTFQVLTKRARRMRDYISARQADDRLRLPIIGAMNMMGAGARRACGYRMWPLPNVWLGVSTERQQEADERIPQLLQTPAAVRFVSAEPLLGPIDLAKFSPVDVDWNPRAAAAGALLGIDWVIVGGESGKNARPMRSDWVRSLRDQCETAGTAFFFKQWGNWQPLRDDEDWGRDWFLIDRHGNPDLPDDRVPMEEFGEYAARQAGKKLAGRLLDGKEHNGMPEILT